MASVRCQRLFSTDKEIFYFFSQPIANVNFPNRISNQFSPGAAIIWLNLMNIKISHTQGFCPPLKLRSKTGSARFLCVFGTRNDDVRRRCRGRLLLMEVRSACLFITNWFAQKKCKHRSICLFLLGYATRETLFYLRKIR